MTEGDFIAPFGQNQEQLFLLSGFDVLNPVGLVVRLQVTTRTDQALVANRDRASVAEMLLRGEERENFNINCEIDEETERRM